MASRNSAVGRLLAMLGLLVATPLAARPLPAPCPQEQEKIDAYVSALQGAQAPGGLLTLYQRARALESLQNCLADLSETDFAELQGRLVGLELNRDELVTALPDAAYFDRRAQETGTVEDRAFFALLRRVYPESNFWAVWDYQLTDVQAVLDLAKINSTHILSDLVQFQQTHPGSPYLPYVQERVEALVERLLLTSHFVESKEEVLREYRAILQTLKEHPRHGELRKKLRALEKADKGFNLDSWQP